MNSEIIRGISLSIFSNFGPESVFMYPTPLEDDDPTINSKNIAERNYLQIAIKSISLLIGDNIFDINKEQAKEMNYFGILPYPDLKVNALTYFRFLILSESELPIACALSLLVNENAKTFLYDYYDQLEKLMKEFNEHLLSVLALKESRRTKSKMSSINFYLKLNLWRLRRLIPF